MWLCLAKSITCHLHTQLHKKSHSNNSLILQSNIQFNKKYVYIAQRYGAPTRALQRQQRSQLTYALYGNSGTLSAPSPPRPTRDKRFPAREPQTPSPPPPPPPLRAWTPRQTSSSSSSSSSVTRRWWRMVSQAGRSSESPGEWDPKTTKMTHPFRLESKEMKKKKKKLALTGAPSFELEPSLISKLKDRVKIMSYEESLIICYTQRPNKNTERTSNSLESIE